MILMVMVGALTQSAMSPREAGEELDNPVPPVITIPVHLDYDGNIGSTAQGTRYKLEMKPVLPMAISEDWAIAARTIAKLEAQTNVTAPNEGQTGFADLSEGLYVAPRRYFAGWFMFAIGATTTLPTATQSEFGTRRVSAGPSVLLRIKPGHFVLGLLTGWVGSLGNSGGSLENVSQVSLEGGASYTTASAWRLALSTTTTFDTLKKEWVAPFDAGVTKVLPVANGHVAVGGGVRVYLDPTHSSPQYGARLEATWTLPEDAPAAR
jgi:hypothetical protein